MVTRDDFARFADKRGTKSAARLGSTGDPAYPASSLCVAHLHPIAIAFRRPALAGSKSMVCLACNNWCVAERIPIACSLDGNAARLRWAKWNSVMSSRLAVDQSPQLLTVRFPNSFDLSAKLSELVAAESECCGFVDWELQDRGEEVHLVVRGDPEGVMAMAESFGLSL